MSAKDEPVSDEHEEYRVTCADGQQIHNLTLKQVNQHLNWTLPSGPAGCGPHVVEKRTITRSEWFPIQVERGHRPPPLPL